MSNLVREIDAGIEEKSLLKHAFYKMWSEGKLTREDLAGYSREYFQLVRAVPEMVEEIRGFMTAPSARRAAAQIQKEEADHVELWIRFAESMGVSASDLMDYRGTAKTQRAVARLKAAARESFAKGASAMYSIEYEQPKISKTKLAGLVEFYGMKGDEKGTEYFREHQTADVRHAAFWRANIEKDVRGKGEKTALAGSKLSASAQNSILDSVMESYVSPRLA